MKKSVKDYIWILVAVGFLSFLGWGVGVAHSEFARQAGRSFFGFMAIMLGILPVMFVLIGLFEEWVPREIIEKHIGENAGAAGIFWVVLLAVLQAGPLYVAFPVAHSLLKKGCAARFIFIYLGAFSVMKLPMLSFEIGFLGWRFSMLRLALTLPVFIAVGYIAPLIAPPKQSEPDINVQKNI